MSGYSDTTDCPRCGGKLNTFSDHKPHDNVFGDCLDCGFSYHTDRNVLSLEEVNEFRESDGLKHLKKLRKPLKDWVKFVGD